jgi:small subunit ribosomal protein S6
VTTYEILLMLDPEGAEAHQDEVIARLRELVEKGGGTWRSHDAWGRRRLAYEIDKKPEGVYHLVVFESSPETLDEISRVLKIDDVVMRHLATKHVEGSRTSAPRERCRHPPHRWQRPSRQCPRSRKRCRRRSQSLKRSPSRSRLPSRRPSRPSRIRP